MVSWQSIGGFFKKRSRSRTLWVSGGSIGIFGVLLIISLLTGVTSQYTGDTVSGECGDVYVNVTSTYCRICFAEDFELVQTIPEVEVETYVPARGKGNWRLFDPTKDCIERKNKYNYLPNRFKITICGNGEKIKWSVDKFDIDPLMISSKILYGNLSRQKKIYNNIKIEVLSVYNEKNTTWSKPYNYTIKEYSHTITEYYSGKRIGVKVGGKDYVGNYNIKGDNLVHWTIPIGDRNFIEYGGCREYEGAKGVCSEVNLLEK